MEETTTHIELNPGIFELLIQRGYEYYAKREIVFPNAQKAGIQSFEILFFKERRDAIWTLLKDFGGNGEEGYIAINGIKDMANGIPGKKFFMPVQVY